MSVTQVPLRPIKRGSMLKLWLGLALLVAAAFGLARLGTAAFRPVTTASGIQFRTLKPGNGPLIQKEDAALVDYVGTFDNGQVFDASRQPVPMIPMAVIPGFAEAMSRMQAGGHYKFRLPPELGYGASPPPGMAPNAPLNFDVTVHEVAPGMGPALLQQQQQQQMQQLQQQMQRQGQSGAETPGEAPPR